MNEEELTIFIEYVDGGWQPGLTDVQKTAWRTALAQRDAKTSFSLILTMIQRERFRPKLPDFTDAYKRAMVDTTPTFTGPQDRDEMPDWARGWHLARQEVDRRLWPEQQPGYEANHLAWLAENTWTKNQIAKFGIKSGYEWEDQTEALGLCPQDERLAYIERAKASGQEEELAALLSGSPAA